jgi:TetR/AcrR family transcriptional regulator, regulator of cefoperazone and chloramphenicol sensitivity
MDAVNPGPIARRPTLRDERALITRARIAEAARRLFTRDGYAATTLVGIAREAGVAVQTVYAVYGSKAGILRVLREAAMDQPDAEAMFVNAMAEPSAPLSLGLFARSIRRRWEQSGDVVAIHRDAGTADPEIRAGEAATLARRRGGILGLANVLAPALRPDVDVAQASAILDALTLPEVYAELVEVQGWTPDRYEVWVAAVLIEELLVADG